MMKRVCNILLLMLFCCIATLHADEVKVTMKSGTTIIGELKELIPTDHIILEIAGVESKFSMNDVMSVERVGSSKSTVNKDDKDLEYGKYDITDYKQYPDSFKITIGDQELTMILVRGGWFNMGYDDRHSWSWNTEPVHRVVLSSFYISKQLISRRVADYLQHKKKVSSSTKPYTTNTRKTAEKIISSLASETMLPYRFLTEAEWEYAALMPFAEKVFNDQNVVEWCKDHWGDYYQGEQINPQGPQDGDKYVVRSYSTDNKKWRRIKSDKFGIQPSYETEFSGTDLVIRIAISADQIKQ